MSLLCIFKLPYSKFGCQDIAASDNKYECQVAVTGKESHDVWGETECSMVSKIHVNTLFC